METCPTAEEAIYPGIESQHYKKVFRSREEADRRAPGIAVESYSKSKPFRYLPAAEWKAMQILFPTAAQVLSDAMISQQK